MNLDTHTHNPLSPLSPPILTPTHLLIYVFTHSLRQYEPTMGDTYTKSVNFSGKTLQLRIRDTAGLYHFAAMKNQYVSAIA